MSNLQKNVSNNDFILHWTVFKLSVFIFLWDETSYDRSPSGCVQCILYKNVNKVFSTQLVSQLNVCVLYVSQPEQAFHNK